MQRRAVVRMVAGLALVAAVAVPAVLVARYEQPANRRMRALVHFAGTIPDCADAQTTDGADRREAGARQRIHVAVISCGPPGDLGPSVAVMRFATAAGTARAIAHVAAVSTEWVRCATDRELFEADFFYPDGSAPGADAIARRRGAEFCRLAGAHPTEPAP